MNTKFLFSFLIVSSLFISCDDDILDLPPEDQLTTDQFFNTAKDLEVATNDFYTMLPTTGTYTDDSSSDNIMSLTPAARIRGGRIVPTERGSGGWNWSRLRDINFFLQHYKQVESLDAQKHYGGIARFFRAYFYFDKVMRFGDVPWYGEVLEAGDEGLYKARDSRVLVMDSIMADIDYAIENIPAEVELNRITKYTAQILKARIALFEGTFRKYHGISGGEDFLEEAANTAEDLMSSGAYSLYTVGGPDEAYRGLFSRNNQDAVETILARDFDQELETHNLGYLMTAPTMGS